MPQANRKPAPASKAADSHQSRRRTTFIVATVVVIIILTILGGGYYFSEDQKNLRRTIITVDDTDIRMGYFIKRAKFAGVSSMAMLEALTREEVIKLAAPRYGIAVTPEDVIQELRSIARTTLGRESIAESEFQEWYRQLLNESQLSDAEFKQIATIGLITSRLQEYLAERMPTVAEQIHLYAILAKNLQDAQQIRAKWEAGADFRGLARELSLDAEAKETGGDLGWIPRGVLEPRLEYAVFNLKPGEVGTPLPVALPTTTQAPDEGNHYLLMVAEKADSREVDPEFLPILKEGVLETWYLAEIQYHKVSYKFNSEIDAWISWQLAKNRPSSEQP